MKSVLVFAAVTLAALLVGVQAKACDYNQKVVVQQVVQVPVVAQVVTPYVQSQVAVVPIVQHQQFVVQKQFVAQRQFVRGGYGGYGGYGGQGFRQAQFVGGGRQRLGGGGGNFLADTINAVGNVANSPAGTFALGVLAGRGF